MASSSLYNEHTNTAPMSTVPKIPVVYGLLIILIATFFTWFIQWRISRRHLYEAAKKVPLPHNVPCYPIIGHALLLSGGTEKITRGIEKIMFHQHGPRVVWLAHRLFYTIDRPEDLEIVLNSPKTMAKDDLYRFSEPVAGTGIFNAELPQWKKNRKIISPTFNKKNLDSFVSIFSEQAEILLNILSKYDGKGVFDINHYLENFALDVVCESAMGVQINSQTSDSELGDNFKRCLDIIMMRMFNVAYHFDFIFNLSSVGREINRLRKANRDITNSVITIKKQEYFQRQKDKLSKVEAEIEENTKRKAFLDLLIELSENGANFTDVELRDETQTLIVAGSDTSSTVLSFACLMMGMHPEFQQKLYEEATEILGADRPVEADDIPKFVYTEKFLKETMRLFPVACLIVRKVIEDLDLGHCTLVKDAGLVCCIVNNHRSAEYFKDPLKFNPENFNPQEICKRHPYSYLPFSHGPRNCIGLKFAMMSMKTALPMLARKFKFETPFKTIEEITYKQALIIRSIKGYPVKITKRD